jgi:hypothetical protein
LKNLKLIDVSREINVMEIWTYKLLYEARNMFEGLVKFRF